MCTEHAIEVDQETGEIIEGELAEPVTDVVVVKDQPTDVIYSERMVAIAERAEQAISIVKKSLALPNGVFKISGKDHVGDVSLKAMAAWANVGMEYGEFESIDNGKGWMVKCTAVRQDGLRIEAYGACERSERYGKNLSSCLGMAQTRARVRALSQMFAALINIANGSISTTPAEEVWANEGHSDDHDNGYRQQPPKRKAYNPRNNPPTDEEAAGSSGGLPPIVKAFLNARDGNPEAFDKKAEGEGYRWDPEQNTYTKA